MRRMPHFAGPVCATLLLLGCESPVAQNPLPPPGPPPSLSVEISGPSRIANEGTYTWEAFAFGGSGAYQYQWEVTRHAGGGSAITTAAQRRLSLHVLDSDGDLSLKLTLVSGSQVRTESRNVSNCINACR